jgi:GNAT superfamily N-acetyltransferase
VRAEIRSARPTDAHGIARVHVASWHGAFRGIVPDEQMAARGFEVRLKQWTAKLQQSDLIVLVACEEGGAVVGFASALRMDDGPFQGYLAALYLAPDAWGRGIGRELLRAVSARLVDAGAKNMVLRTLRLGSARAFYEHLGARLVPEGFARDAGHFDDVVYAFDDLSALAARQAGGPAT